MRLWSLHPTYLDTKGLLALWRESLLARKVLEGKTKGYKHHPQLIRFKDCADPIECLDIYLMTVLDESKKRGYHFDQSKIQQRKIQKKIQVTEGQILFEKEHLLTKLQIRDKKRFESLKLADKIDVNPVFDVIKGTIEKWEKQMN